MTILRLDPIIQLIVSVLNGFAGITTSGSCGGHEDPSPWQEKLGNWSVTFRVEHTENGWLSLEFIAWAVNDWRKAGYEVMLSAHSFPPFLNEPGDCLYFALSGKSVNADGFAAWLGEAGAEHGYLE